MTYVVRMQEEDDLSFWHGFSDEDARAIREAEDDVRFELSNGFGTLFPDGQLVLTFRRGSGHRLHVLDYREVIRQFDQHEPDDNDI